MRRAREEGVVGVSEEVACSGCSSEVTIACEAVENALLRLSGTHEAAVEETQRGEGATTQAPPARTNA